MKIKTAELFCASPASTAICTTMNQHAMVRRGSTTPRLLNHHHRHHHHDYYNNHYQFDFGDKPKFKVPTIPCTSQHHIDPKPYTTYLQNRKSTSSVTGKNGDLVARRKSSSSAVCGLNNEPAFVADFKVGDDDGGGGGCNDGALVVSEPVWPRYGDDEVPVLRKSVSARRLKGGDPMAMVKSRSPEIRVDRVAESPRLKPSRSRDQVVELRVSIHCKGCEGKVRKHISRMEGVTSFHIDLESKKVTVVGDVTPSSVLSSISKVKNAQLWPSTSPSSSSPLIAIGY